MKETSMVNLMDVAKLADVSIATVSRTLNDSPLVNASTKRKVWHAVDELGYQPNFLARNLRCGETKIIMCMLISMSNFFMTEFTECFRGMWEVAYKNGYKVILCPVETSKNIELEFLSLIKNQLVDGVILISSMLDSEELASLCSTISACSVRRVPPGRTNWTASQSITRKLLMRRCSIYCNLGTAASA